MEQRWRQRQRTLLAVAGLWWLAYKVMQWGRQANLDGQVVLITGGSRGLGLALARVCAGKVSGGPRRSGCPGTGTRAAGPAATRRRGAGGPL
jgi:hypothetical protein